MRDLRKGTCPLCEHNEVIESVAAEFSHSSAETPMSVTYDARWVVGGRNPRHGHGALRMYVCRSCGYVQWFADHPEKIPVSPEFGTRIIKGTKPEAPFR